RAHGLDGCCRGPGAAGQCPADATLPDAEVDLGGTAQRGDLDIGPAFDARAHGFSELVQRCCAQRLVKAHRMWISRRYAREAELGCLPPVAQCAKMCALANGCAHTGG